MCCSALTHHSRRKPIVASVRAFVIRDDGTSAKGSSDTATPAAAAADAAARLRQLPYVELKP